MKKWMTEDRAFEITVIKGKAEHCRMDLDAGDRFSSTCECPAGFCPKTMPVLHTLCEIARCGGDYKLRGSKKALRLISPARTTALNSICLQIISKDN